MISITKHGSLSGTSVSDQSTLTDRAGHATIPPGVAGSGRGKQADVEQTPVIATGEGQIGRIVVGSLIAGLVTAILLVAISQGRPNTSSPARSY